MPTLDPATTPRLGDVGGLTAEPEIFWADDSRWLLYLQDTDGTENWHLFRVDLAAPEEPATDLTPLPQSSRVFTVDPLVTMPGTVLVSMKERSSHTDYLLIDVATGETTARLPADSPHEAAEGSPAAAARSTPTW